MSRYDNQDTKDSLDVQLEMGEVADPTLEVLVKDKSGLTSIEKVDEAGLNDLKNGHLRKEKPEATEPDNDKDNDSGDETDAFDHEDDEDPEQAWKEADCLSRGIILLQNTGQRIHQFLTRVTHGHLCRGICLVAYLVYFAVAMWYRFGDEGSHRLLGVTVVTFAFILYPYFKKLVKTAVKAVCGPKAFSIQDSTKKAKVYRAIRWSIYLAMLVLMIYTLVDEGLRKPMNMRSLPGIFIFLFIAFLFSKRPSKINWHSIFCSVALQFVCALFVLKLRFGRKSVLWVQSRFNEFMANAGLSSSFWFGESYTDHEFIFGSVPLIMFMNSFFTMMYYLGIMQYVIGTIGNILKFVIGVTPLEAMGVSAGIFMEGYTNLVVMRPFLTSMSKSQLFAVITGCMSSVGGAYLGLLSSFGISLEYLIPAMLVSAPATFAICKLMVPEVRQDDTQAQGDCMDLCKEEKGRYRNLMDAAMNGAMSMLSVCASITVMGFSFTASIYWINHTLGWFGDRVGIHNLSIEMIASYVLYPVALAMGVEPEDCRQVAMLLGYRIGILNVIAFLKLRELNLNKMKFMEYMTATNFTGPVSHYRDDITLDSWNVTLANGFISDRSEAIATYSLCGFSSAASAVIHLGVIFTLAPKRKNWVSGMTIPAIVAGNLANCMTGCFASLFF